MKPTVFSASALFVLFVFATASSVMAEGPRFYVSGDAAAGGDGGSWATALDDVQVAVDSALSAVKTAGGAEAGATAEVWVKAGTYGLDGAVASRGGLSGLQLYGGFAGTETEVDQRADIHHTHATILRQDAAGARVIDLETQPDELINLQFFAAGAITIEWQAVIGETYTIEFAEDTEGPWNDVSGPLVADSADMSHTIEDGAGGFYRVLERSGDPVQRHFRLDGFTLTGARDVDAHGGGLLIRQAGPNVVIANCIIAGNTSLGRGAGVAVLGNSTYPSEPTIIDSEIVNNMSMAAGSFDGGGGIYFHSSSGGLVQDTIISGNWADGPRGGGVYVQGNASNPSLVFATSRISNNSARQDGGGIFTVAPIAIRQSVIAGNVCRAVSSEGQGGGGIFTTTSNSNITIEGSILSGNILRGDAERAAGAGAQFRQAGTVSIVNSIISGNQALGGTQVRGSALYFRESNLGAVVRHCTIAENLTGRTAGNDGGTINIRAGEVSIHNTIFGLNNDAGIKAWHVGVADAKGNLFHANEGVAAEGETPVGDPRFVSEGDNALVGTWEMVEIFEADSLTGLGVTWVTAGGSPFDEVDLVGRMINPNTAQMRQALVVAQAGNLLLIEGNLAEEFGAEAGGSFKVIDYRIEEESAAIDTGDPTVSLPVDFTGASRPQGAGSDVGAFEFSSGVLEIVSLGVAEQEELALVFVTPFGNRDHVIEHRENLDAGDWVEQSSVVLTALGDGLFEARFPMGEGSRGFYRVNAVTPEPLLQDDFEGDVSGWSLGGVGQLWEHGDPTTGPGSAFSGINVFATGLDGNYTANTNSWLRSPEIDLTGVSAATLRFQEYRNVDSNIAYHQTIVSILDPDTFEVIEELSRKAGTTDGWEAQAFFLGSESLDRRIVVEFRLQSDQYNLREGWYIDDVSLGQ